MALHRLTRAARLFRPDEFAWVAGAASPAPQYHGDHLRGFKVLVYQDYGPDILQRPRDMGFTNAALHRFPTSTSWFGFSRQAASARKPA